LRAEKIMQNRLFKNPKIEVIWDTVLEEILGTDNPPAVTGAKLRNVKTGEIAERAFDGVFIAIGHDPASKVFAGQVEMDDEGYILVEPGKTATSMPGVFAAGDVTDKVYRQAVTAAGLGCMAALEAEKYLAEQEDSASIAAE